MGETNIDKEFIGDIDVYDKFSFVEVESSLADEMLEKLNGARIKGKKITVEIANPKKR